MIEEDQEITSENYRINFDNAKSMIGLENKENSVDSIGVNGAIVAAVAVFLISYAGIKMATKDQQKGGISIKNKKDKKRNLKENLV